MANFFFRKPDKGLSQLQSYGYGVESPVGPWWFQANIGAGVVYSGGHNSFSLAAFRHSGGEGEVSVPSSNVAGGASGGGGGKLATSRSEISKMNQDYLSNNGTLIATNNLNNTTSTKYGTVSPTGVTTTNATKTSKVKIATGIGYLTSATVTLEGDFGSLVRAEINFKCSINQINAVDNSMLQLGADVTIKFGRTSGQGGTYTNLKVYDHSFSINADDTVDCKVKAVGKGQELFDRSITETPTVYESTLFRAGYADGQEDTKYAYDWLTHLDGVMQSDTGQLNASDAFQAPNMCSNAGEKGYLIRYTDNRGDALFTGNEFDFNGDNDTQDARGIYYSLKAIIEAIKLQPGYTFEIVGGSGADMATQLYFKDQFLPSANPLQCLFLYGTNTDGASYWYDRESGLPGLEADADEGYNASGNCTWFDLTVGGIGDILIYRSEIVSILRKQEANDQDTENQPEPKFFVTVQSFFDKIFALIKQNSGGAIDFGITLDPEQGIAGTANKYILINKRNPEPFPGTGEIKKGMKGLLDVNITSKVPSKAAAAAFAQNDPSSNRTATTQKAGALISNQTGQGASDDYGNTVEKWQINQAMHSAQAEDFKGNSGMELQNLLKKLVGSISPAEAARRGVLTWPLELKISLLGCDGWRFGDTIVYNNLPERYKTSEGKVRVGFTVTRAQHKFSKEWETDLTTVCRFIQ